MTREELNEISTNTLIEFTQLHRNTICSNFVQRQDFSVENKKFTSCIKDFLNGTSKEERKVFLLIVFYELGKEYEDVLRTSVGVPVGNRDLNRYLHSTAREIVYELGFGNKINIQEGGHTMSKKKDEKPKIVVPGPQNSARLGTPGDKPQKTASNPNITNLGNGMALIGRGSMKGLIYTI